MTTYSNLIAQCADTIGKNGDHWSAIDAEYVTRMKLQNRFATGLDIAKYTAGIMREDTVSYTHLTLPTICSV